MASGHPQSAVTTGASGDGPTMGAFAAPTALSPRPPSHDRALGSSANLYRYLRRTGPVTERGDPVGTPEVGPV